MRKLIFILLASALTQLSFAQKSDKVECSRLIVGKWLNKIDKTKDGKEYTGLTCKGTMQYFQDGNYIWKQCSSKQTGKWKISSDNSKVILFERRDEEWEPEVGITDIGEMEIPIFSLTKSEFVTVFYLETDDKNNEDNREIRQHYFRVK